MICVVVLQKGAYSKDMLFVEQLLNGLVASRAIRDILALSQASGMFQKVHKHLLRAGGLPPDVQLSLHMSSLAGLDPLQVGCCLFHETQQGWILYRWIVARFTQDNRAVLAVSKLRGMYSEVHKHVLGIWMNFLCFETNSRGALARSQSNGRFWAAHMGRQPAITVKP